MRAYLGIVGVLSIGAAIFGGIGWFANAPLRDDLALCDDAIKTTLKAPATYVRVEAPSDRRSSYRIVYDAQNSFGAPLRSNGFCTIDSDGTSATWVELTNPNA